jgi:hypothetical protein
MESTSDRVLDQPLKNCALDVRQLLNVEASLSLSRVTLGKIVLAWAIFLWCAAMVLPNLDSHTRVHPVVKAIITVVYVLYLIGTPIALVIYFKRAWGRVPTVPNKSAYVIWMSL